MLGHRGYAGHLGYRHDKKRLHINVSASSSSTATKDAKHDIRQLSGGEKSYGTACFLFALWDAMSTPLFCLDEFDVYMVGSPLLSPGRRQQTGRNRIAAEQSHFRRCAVYSYYSQCTTAVLAR